MEFDGQKTLEYIFGNTELLKKFSAKKTYQPGEYIVTENESGQSLYFILAGKVEIVRKASDKEEVKVGELGQNQFFGEMALWESDARSASVRALTIVMLMSINKDSLKEMKESDPKLYAALMEKLNKQIANRLRYVNDNVVKSYEEQIEQNKLQINMGRFFFANVVVGFFHTFSLRISIDLAGKQDSVYITSTMLVIVAFVLVSMMKYSGYPMSFYGLTLKNWKKHTGEAILWTIPFLIVMTLVKWLWVYLAKSPEPIFYFERILEGNYKPGIHTPPLQVLLAALLYCIFSPVQELISRGAIQSSLHYFFIGKYANTWAIVLTTLLFAMSHFHVSVGLALVSIIPGIFWGILFARQRSLVGVSVSHIIIGLWALYGLALQRLM